MIIWGADVLARKQKLLDQPQHLLVPYLPVGRAAHPAGRLPGRRRHRGGDAASSAGCSGSSVRRSGSSRRWPPPALRRRGRAVLTSPIRISRLEAFLDPTVAANGINDQSTTGMYAIASGGWWGVGLGASRQKWGRCRRRHSDFIFAVIGEELGLFGSLVVLALFLVLGYAGMRIAARSDDPFNRYAAGGVTVWFMVQALINLGRVLRLLPIAGVPLPLVSYGGSALLANLLGDRRAAGLRPPRTRGPAGCGLPRAEARATVRIRPRQE